MDFLSNHWLDITTTALGLAYILLEYKASVWMWSPAGCISIKTSPSRPASMGFMSSSLCSATSSGER